MTTPTEHAADYMRGYGISEERGLRIARTLQDAGLLAAPVDGELREALAKRLAEHPEAFQSDGDYGERQWIECSCGSDDTYVDDTEYVDDSVWRSGYVKHVADTLLLIIAAHVAEEKRKLREEIGAAVLYERLIDNTGVPVDVAYNQAIDDALDAIARGDVDA